MMAVDSMFALVPDCRYYTVSDMATQTVIAILEAGDEAEAHEFYAALCPILQATLTPHICQLDDAMMPNGVPVFRRQYLEAMQLKAEEESRVLGTTRH